MAKWSRKWKIVNLQYILFLPQNWPTQWLTLSEAEGDCQDCFTKTVAPKCPESVPPSRDLYVSSRTFRSPRHGGFAWCEGSGTNPRGTHPLLGQKTVEKQAFTWRFIPVSKQLATMSPNWGCSPSKWPFHGLKCGLLTTCELTKWDDPPSIKWPLPSEQGRPGPSSLGVFLRVHGS